METKRFTRTSLESEVPRLKEIWKKAFGDEDAYIDRFFELYYRPERVMTLHDNGVLMSAIHTFDMRCIRMPDSSIISAGVTYALGTDPEHLGHGYGMQCMDAALAMQADAGKDCSIQVPANDTLFVQYHDRIGYDDAFYVREAHISACDIPGDFSGSLERVLPQDYDTLRESQLKGLCHVSFDEEGINYQQALCADADGGMHKINTEKSSGCAVIEMLPDNVVFIKELLIDNNCLWEAAALIADEYPGTEYIIRTPSDRGNPLGGEVRRFAMSIFFGDKVGTLFPRELNAYFGLAYD